MADIKISLMTAAGALTGAEQIEVVQSANTRRSTIDAVIAYAMQYGRFKDSVRAATTANITLSGAQTIDGVSVIATNRVLVKDQSSGAENGIYVAAAGAWARATDFDLSAEVVAGAATFVAEGTANGDQGFLLATNNPITIGSTALVFQQFTGGAGISDGDKGHITVSASGATWEIDDEAVSNAKLAHVATATFKGRTTGGTGDAEDLTATQATALLNNFVGDSGSGGTKGLVVAPASGDATKFLRGDATWQSVGGDAADIDFDSSGLTHTDAADVQEAIEDHDVALESMQDDIDALAGGGAALVASDLIWDAKGDLAAATGNNAASKLPVGANGDVLIAESSETTGLRWGAANDLHEQSGAPTTVHGRRWHDIDLGIMFTWSPHAGAWVEF